MKYDNKYTLYVCVCVCAFLHVFVCPRIIIPIAVVSLVFILSLVSLCVCQSIARSFIRSHMHVSNSQCIVVKFMCKPWIN